MNWTGGRLQQSRRSSTTMTAKQRATSAKFRAQILNGRKPPTPPEFDIASAFPRHKASTSSTSNKISQHHGSTTQRGLYDSSNVVPSGQRLTSTGAPDAAADYPQRGNKRKRKAQTFDLSTEGMDCTIESDGENSYTYIHHRRPRCKTLGATLKMLVQPATLTATQTDIHS